MANIDEQAIIDALTQYALLKRSNDLLVVSIDLSTPRQHPTEISDFADSLSITIFQNTGTFTLYINKASVDHSIIISPLGYPQMLVIDWLDIKKIFITNAAQVGQSAQIIKFFRA